MTDNEAAVRKAYQVAENKAIARWVDCFTQDSAFTDESIGVTYRFTLSHGILNEIDTLASMTRAPATSGLRSRKSHDGRLAGRFQV